MLDLCPIQDVHMSLADLGGGGGRVAPGTRPFHCNILKQNPTVRFHRVCNWSVRVDCEDIFVISCSGGSRISKRGLQSLKGAPTYYLTNFSQKLHEKEEILSQATD